MSHVKANELRLGNIVMINKAVLRLTPELFCLLITGELAPAAPIPLTPSVLEAAGFELINSFHPTYYFSQSDAVLELLLSPDEKTWMTKIYNSYSELSTRFVLIKNTYYLHELQNLYFALTGTELTIDINKLK